MSQGEFHLDVKQKHRVKLHALTRVVTWVRDFARSIHGTLKNSVPKYTFSKVVTHMLYTLAECAGSWSTYLSDWVGTTDMDPAEEV